MERDALSKLASFGYSVGHSLNDLSVVLWVYYLAYYLQYVVGLSPSVASACVLSG